MAGDWIKMRLSLVTHPKVISLAERLASNPEYQDWSGIHWFVPSIGGTQEDFNTGVMQALRVTRYVTVTALLKFWGYANEHARDDFINALRIADIDEITQVPGFGSAIEAVGWATYDKERKGTYMPNFSEHNATASDRGAAARQKRYREKRKTVTLLSNVTSDVTRDVTVTDREEKRREEKNNKNSLSGKPDRAQFKSQAKEVIDFLNTKSGKGYHHVDSNLNFVIARMKEGFTVQQMKTVIVRKCRDWLGDPEMEIYLRPETLFNATKFASYVGQCVEVPE